MDPDNQRSSCYYLSTDDPFHISEMWLSSEATHVLQTLENSLGLVEMVSTCYITVLRQYCNCFQVCSAIPLLYSLLQSIFYSIIFLTRNYH